MLTLAEHTDAVRDHLDEPTARAWTDIQLHQWINDAAKDIARRTESLEDYFDQATTAGDGDYTAQDDTLRIHRIEWRNGTLRIPLEYRDYHSMDVQWWGSQERQGDPMWYTLWGFPPNDLNIKVFPTPNAIATLRIFFYRLPAPAELDADPVEVVEGWEDLVKYYAEFVALRKDRDPRWQEAHSIYEARLADMINLSPRWTDTPDAVRWQRMAPMAPTPVQNPPPGVQVQYPNMTQYPQA